jgi:inosine-uridine nucleoside N-ribohydrolase
VWADTDVALGASHGDVDDGYALAALFRAAARGEIEVLGVSTVFGNASAAESEECARELARRAVVSTRIVPGAEKPDRESEASDTIAALPAGTTLLCLGPLSNVAAACQRDPELPSRVFLHAVGGNLSSRGFLPPLWPFEFNFLLDRRSARFVLSRSWKELTLYPLDVVRSLSADRRRLADLQKSSPLGAYLAGQSERWLLRRRWRYFGRSFPLWDLPVALDLVGGFSAVHGARKLAPDVRRLAGAKREFRCLISLDADDAWRVFLRLLG